MTRRGYGTHSNGIFLSGKCSATWLAHFYTLEDAGLEFWASGAGPPSGLHFDWPMQPCSSATSKWQQSCVEEPEAAIDVSLYHAHRKCQWALDQRNKMNAHVDTTEWPVSSENAWESAVSMTLGRCRVQERYSTSQQSLNESVTQQKKMWICLKIVYPYTQWLMIIIPTKRL